MADISGFDAQTVEPNEGRGLITRGDYDAIIIESERQVNSKGTGWFIKIVFQILSGAFQNRKLYLNLNLGNANADAVAIAKGQLSAICRAVNVMQPKDTVELHDKPLKISVGVRKNKESGDMENNLNGFKSRVAAPVAAASAASAASSPGANANKPW